MATTFTMTLNNTNSPSMGGTKASERLYLADQLNFIAQRLSTGTLTEAAVKDRGNVSIGTWTYTPIAAH